MGVALAPWVLAAALVTLILDAEFASQARRQVRSFAPVQVEPRAPEPKTKGVTYSPDEKVPS